MVPPSGPSRLFSLAALLSTHPARPSLSAGPMPQEVRDHARRNGRIIPDDGDTPSSALPARSDRGDATLSEALLRRCAKTMCRWTDAPLAVTVYYSRCYVTGWGAH